MNVIGEQLLASRAPGEEEKGGAQIYKTDYKPTWCPGCGDYGVLAALYKAMAALDLSTENTALISGIGCSSRIPGFVNVYGFNSVHGRGLPMAMGVKLARPELTVIMAGGDGDGFAIGGGHLPHVARRNVDLTYIVMDNQIYGLTKGQAAPTSSLSFETGTTPYGAIEEPVNPIAFALVYGATFVARGFSSRQKELTDLMVAAIRHKGFSFLQVLSPCPTFNKVDTFKAYSSRIADMPGGHDASDSRSALALALGEDKLHMGIFYQAAKPTFQDRWAEVMARSLEEGPVTLEDLVNRYC
jgi:2-oxoglutarate ferredoxin oxidoreductase subunit beta